MVFKFYLNKKIKLLKRLIKWKKTTVTNSTENGKMMMEYLNDSSFGNTGLRKGEEK